jgi:hypothetical protein
MQFVDVLKDICAQVGDPNMESLKARAKDHFFRAVTALQDGASEAELPGYHKVITAMFRGDKLTLTDRVRKFTDIYHSSHAARVIWKNLEDISRLANSESRPAADEVFVWQHGRNLYCYRGENFGATSMFTVSYQTEIVSSIFTDNVDVSDYFGESFIRKAINAAAESLLMEDSR